MRRKNERALAGEAVVAGDGFDDGAVLVLLVEQRGALGGGCAREEGLGSHLNKHPCINLGELPK